MPDRWRQLSKEIDERRPSRDHSVEEIKNGIARRLVQMGKDGYCSRDAIGWLRHRRDGAITKIELKENADGKSARGHPAITLRGLDHLDDGAVLTFVVDVERDSLRSYSVSIVGSRRAHDAEAVRPFYARIDLDDEPKGHGLCSHPLLHCHVGADAGPNDKLSPRTPLPWLHPVDALDWLLASVHPVLEPSPHPK